MNIDRIESFIDEMKAYGESIACEEVVKELLPFCTTEFIDKIIKTYAEK